MNDMVEAVALALQKEAQQFGRPVASYVEGEAQRLWEAANPGKDALFDGPPVDWDLESWKILARVAIAAVLDTAPHDLSPEVMDAIKAQAERDNEIMKDMPFRDCAVQPAPDQAKV